MWRTHTTTEVVPRRLSTIPQIHNNKASTFPVLLSDDLFNELHEDVARPSIVRVKYLDEDFNEHEEELTGIRARIFQHEYDHLEGKVFTDRLSPLRRTLLKRKLNDVASGKIVPGYKMKRPQTKKK